MTDTPQDILQDTPQKLSFAQMKDHLKILQYSESVTPEIFCKIQELQKEILKISKYNWDIHLYNHLDFDHALRSIDTMMRNGYNGTQVYINLQDDLVLYKEKLERAKPGFIFTIKRSGHNYASNGAISWKVKGTQASPLTPVEGTF